MTEPTSLTELVWMTSQEAAAYARVGYSTMRQALADGECRSVSAGPQCKRRTRREWVDSWVESRGSSGRRKRSA